MQLFGTILVLISVSGTLAEINPKWRNPSAFERHKHKIHIKEGSGSDESCTNVVQHCEAPPDPYADTIAAKLYKRFVHFIFNRKKLMRDGISENYIRDMQFKITNEELQKLESTEDIREIDGIISDIIFKSKDSSLHNIVMTEFSYFLSNAANLLATKNAMFVLGGLCFIVFIWCISRYSKKGFIASALLAMLVVSYVITYIQCNDKKVTDKLFKLMEHDQKYCNVGDKPEPGILNSIRSIFVTSSNSPCISKMREAYSSELDICTPAEVLVVMVAQLNMKYFEEFVHQLIRSFQSLTASHWWYEKIIIFISMLGFIGLLIYIFVKFTLKYGFQYIWHSNHSSVPTTNAAAVEASISQQKLTETVQQLKSTCDGLAKKIRQRRHSSQAKIIIVESGSRVQEIKSASQASIDSGGSGDKQELDGLGETDEISFDSDSDFQVVLERVVNSTRGECELTTESANI